MRANIFISDLFNFLSQVLNNWMISHVSQSECRYENFAFWKYSFLLFVVYILSPSFFLFCWFLAILVLFGVRSCSKVNPIFQFRVLMHAIAEFTYAGWKLYHELVISPVISGNSIFFVNLLLFIAMNVYGDDFSHFLCGKELLWKY